MVARYRDFADAGALIAYGPNLAAVSLTAKRAAWKTVCRRASVTGMIRHDFRRTAVRNMVDAGVPECVDMTVTGHETCAVFDRDHIVSPSSLQDGARRLAGHNLGTSTLDSAAGRGGCTP